MEKSIRVIASEIPFEHESKNNIYKTYFAVHDYYKKRPNPGACHLISSILHILLIEQNINNDLCIGEVTENRLQFFDHSWIEIDGKVFDIAILLTLNEDVNPPVYASYTLDNGDPVQRIYGVSSPRGLDPVAKSILNKNFVKYLNGYGHYNESAWDIVKVIGKDLRLKLNIPTLQTKYTDTTRKLVTHR